MHLTFILVKITLLNARVTSVRALCCVDKFFSISHKSGSLQGRRIHLPVFSVPRNL